MFCVFVCMCLAAKQPSAFVAQAIAEASSAAASSHLSRAVAENRPSPPGTETGRNPTCSAISLCVVFPSDYTVQFVLILPELWLSASFLCYLHFCMIHCLSQPVYWNGTFWTFISLTEPDAVTQGCFLFQMDRNSTNVCNDIDYGVETINRQTRAAYNNNNDNKTTFYKVQ